jgi:hypothetical protein
VYTSPALYLVDHPVQLGNAVSLMKKEFLFLFIFCLDIIQFIVQFSASSFFHLDPPIELLGSASCEYHINISFSSAFHLKVGFD